MARQILIPLKEHDRPEEILPYLEEIAQPGTEVVFLVRCKQGGFGWLSHQSTIMQTEIRTLTAVRTLAIRDFWQRQIQLTKQRTLPAREALKRKGVAVGVQCYMGSLGKAIANCSGVGSKLVLVSMESQTSIGKFLALFRFLRGCLQTASTPFVLILCPRQP
jgi:hypothetical protein